MSPLNVAVIPTSVEWGEAVTESGFREGKCESVGLCATPIIQLNYVILNHIYLQRQGIIKAANMVENCIKLRQDKVDYVHE